MVDLVPQLQFGRVAGFFFAMIGSGPDLTPDQVPINGQAVFTPPFEQFQVQGVGLGAATPITVNIVDGFLVDNGLPYVSLVANDIPQGQNQGFKYVVSFKNVSYTGPDGKQTFTKFNPISVPVPTWHDGDPYVNVPDYVAASASAGTTIVRGAPGMSAYQTWLALGNAGTEQDFIDYLASGGTGGGGGGGLTVVNNNDRTFTIHY